MMRALSERRSAREADPDRFTLQRMLRFGSGVQVSSSTRALPDCFSVLSSRAAHLASLLLFSGFPLRQLGRSRMANEPARAFNANTAPLVPLNSDSGSIFLSRTFLPQPAIHLRSHSRENSTATTSRASRMTETSIE